MTEIAKSQTTDNLVTRNQAPDASPPSVPYGFDRPATTTYGALRYKVNQAVDAMIEVDNMWSHVSIPRLKRAWLAAIDSLEAEAKRMADAEATRASMVLSGRIDGK